jgi:hypothetical protein
MKTQGLVRVRKPSEINGKSTVAKNLQSAAHDV